MHTICIEPIQIGRPMQICTYLTNILLELKRPIDVLTNFRGYYFQPAKNLVKKNSLGQPNQSGYVILTIILDLLHTYIIMVIKII